MTETLAAEAPALRGSEKKEEAKESEAKTEESKATSLVEKLPSVELPSVELPKMDRAEMKKKVMAMLNGSLSLSSKSSGPSMKIGTLTMHASDFAAFLALLLVFSTWLLGKVASFTSATRQRYGALDQPLLA